jgi:hypothetical protein
MAGDADHGQNDAAHERPGTRLNRATRRLGWVAATASAILLGAGFSWTLGRAASAPPTQMPLPAAEEQVVQQSQALGQRIQTDQQQLAGLAGQIQQLTQAGAVADPSAQGAMPMPHTFTGAS